MWKLNIADDEERNTVVNLVREQYTIGRSEGNSVRLTERNISRKHARLTRAGEGYRIEDLSSYNGLYINGLRLAGRQELAHGDLIQLGDYRVHVVSDAIDTQEQGYRALPGTDLDRAPSRLPHRLVELIGPNQGAEFILDGERFLLGRGEECEFTLDHGSVSRVHAEVRTLEEGLFEIIDKGSANGLRINGRELNRAILDSRDVVELGDVVLKYIPKGQDFRANASEGSRIAAMAGSTPPPSQKGSTRVSVLPKLIAAIIGAALVATAVATFWGQASDQNEEVRLPQELSSAALALHNGRLEETALLLSGLDGATRSLGDYQKLELAWADAVLKLTEQSSGSEDPQLLLALVAKRASLPREIRDAATQRLAHLSEGAIDLGTLDGGSELAGE